MNIIHRDLKPENLLFATMDEGAVVKIGDFGMGRFITPGEMATTAYGTPNYLAPEIVAGVGYDKTVDFWAIGVILYTL